MFRVYTGFREVAFRGSLGYLGWTGVHPQPPLLPHPAPTPSLLAPSPATPRGEGEVEGGGKAARRKLVW